MSKLTTSVIIVGGGPVGLGLACELGLRGVDCMLVEKRDASVTEPKQSMVSSRNMEFCRRWGVAQAVRTAIWPESYPRDFVYLDTLRGRELLRVRQASFTERDRGDYTPEAPCPCPQIYFDPILMARMKTFATVRPHYNTSLDSFTQDDDGVEALLTDQMTDRTRTVRARYLVGCDGPAGTIREQLGIRLEGRGTIAKSLNLYFRSTELPALHDKGWARFYRVIDDTGCWGELIPMDGKELWRLTVFDAPLSAAEPDFLIRKMAGGTFPYAMLSISPWDRRDYVATSYGHGRAFISGDAAHQCSPTGGIGMHTGLEEVVNLAWKLDAMLAGWGGPALLASYEAERRPIAVRNVEYATRTYNALASIPGLRGADDPAAWNKEPPHWLSIPEHLKSQYCYKGSPICALEDAAPEAETTEFVPSTRPGARAPHAWLADGRSTLDLYGGDFVLLRLGANSPDTASLSRAASACGVPLSVATLADPELTTIYEKPLVLVRPDGHVAWRGDEPPVDAQALINRVRGAEGHAQAIGSRAAERLEA